MVIRMAAEIINAKRVKRIDADGNVKIYDSVNMAAEDNHIYANQISRSVRIGKPVKGYRYEYVWEKEKTDFYMPIMHPVYFVAKANFERKPYYFGN